MDVLGAHSYSTLVELEREDYNERKLKRWWGSFLMVIEHSFSSFSEMPLLSSTPH